MTIQDTQTPRHPYPVHVTAELDPHLSRGLWLIKWLLALPHYVVLWFLWIGFVVSSIVAFLAIVFTGRFPRRLFDFNVGVMRWTWRVTYYAYGGLGTDRYPPFTLSDVPDYPAHFDVEYPARLSRGLVLVKWWLLALPHYLVVALFVSGGFLAAGQASGDAQPFLLGGGLVGLLVLVAAVTLLFTGRYPRPVFDLIIGLQRWVLRVAAYAALMTDEYPPFRLDQGGAVDDGHDGGADGNRPTQAASVPTATVPRRAKVVMIGGVVSLVLATVLAVAAASLWVAKTSLPDDEGFFTAPTASCRVDTYAVTSEPLRVDFSGPGRFTPHGLLGDGRVSVESRDGAPVFVGITETKSVQTYLAGVGRSTMVPERHFEDGNPPICESSGGEAPGAAPASLPMWTTFAQGPGRQSITWPVREGSWTVVIMNPDGSAGLDISVDAGATLPGIDLVIALLLFTMAFFLLLGLAMVIGSAAAVRSLRRDPATASAGPDM